MFKVINICTSVLVCALLTSNVSGKSVVILSNNSADIEQFQSEQGHYLNIETNQIIFDHIKNDFTLKHMLVPRAREYLKMAMSIPTCGINNIKTPERSEKYFFSLPVTLFTTLRLYQKKSDASLPVSLLDEQGNVTSLNELFKLQVNKKILLVKDIKYPTSIQPQLDQIKHSQILFLKNSILNGQNVRLLERDRINYIIDYPQVVNDWYAKQGTENKLTSYSIAGLEPLVAGYIICNESAVNTGVLAKINESIIKLYQDGSFYAIYTKYLDKKDVEVINNYLADLLKLSPYNINASE